MTFVIDRGNGKPYVLPDPDAVQVPAVRSNVGARQIEVWEEGFALTGDRGRAHRIGMTYARSFPEACDILLEGDPDYNSERLSRWGCRLFPTEREARELFG